MSEVVTHKDGIEAAQAVTEVLVDVSADGIRTIKNLPRETIERIVAAYLEARGAVLCSKDVESLLRQIIEIPILPISAEHAAAQNGKTLIMAKSAARRALTTTTI
jgi:hypothetical protein